MTNPGNILKSRGITFPTKVLYSQSYGFSSSHVCMWELDHKEGWKPKNWCFWIMMLENILESPLDCKEIKPVNLEGNQPWIFIGRSDAESEASIIWPPDVNRWLIGKDPNLGKIKGRKRKGQQRMRWLDGTTNSLDMILGKLPGWWGTEKPGMLQPVRLRRVRHVLVTEQQQ